MAARRFRPATRVALFLAGGGRCAVCGCRLQPAWHADHVIPWHRGGTSDPANGQALCPQCNLRKGGRTE
jgi:5-methylcytosine-specific restriction endonuclease McrA